MAKLSLHLHAKKKYILKYEETNHVVYWETK